MNKRSLLGLLLGLLAFGCPDYAQAGKARGLNSAQKRNAILEKMEQRKCFGIATMTVYQKLDDNSYEVGDIKFEMTTYRTRAILKTTTRSWDTSGAKYVSMWATNKGKVSLKSSSGFPMQVTVLEESPKCAALYKEFKSLER